jgi:hypothetical protein
MPLPIIKVASLLLKSASKPISKMIKNQTTKSPVFQGFVVRTARLWHDVEGVFQGWAGEANKKPRKELNIAAAVDLGAELASEGFLLLVAVGLLVLESARNSAKEKAKADALNERLTNIEENLNRITTIQLEQQERLKQYEAQRQADIEAKNQSK